MDSGTKVFCPFGLSIVARGQDRFMQAPDREVYTRDKVVFPLSDIAEKAVENFSDPSTDGLEKFDPLPIFSLRIRPS